MSENQHIEEVVLRVRTEQVGQPIEQTLAKVSAAESKADEYLKRGGKTQSEVTETTKKQARSYNELFLARKADERGTNQHTEATKKLARGLQALEYELGNIPGLGSAIRVLSHPFVLIAVAIGAAIAAVRNFSKAADEAAQKSRAFEDTVQTMESLKVTTAKVNSENSEFLKGLADIAKDTRTVAEAQKEYAAALDTTARLKNELIDAEMAAKIAGIEADPNLSGADKSRLKAQAQQEARGRKKQSEQDTASQKHWSLGIGAKDADKAAAAAQAEFLGLSDPLEKARREKARADIQKTQADEGVTGRGKELQKRITEIKQKQIEFGGMSLAGKIASNQTTFSLQNDLSKAEEELAQILKGAENAALGVGHAGDKVKSIEEQRNEAKARATQATKDAAGMRREAGTLAGSDKLSRAYRERIDAANAAKAQSEQGAEQRRLAREKSGAEAHERIKLLEGVSPHLRSKAQDDELDSLRRGVIDTENEGPDKAGVRGSKLKGLELQKWEDEVKRREKLGQGLPPGSIPMPAAPDLGRLGAEFRNAVGAMNEQTVRLVSELTSEMQAQARRLASLASKVEGQA